MEGGPVPANGEEAKILQDFTEIRADQLRRVLSPDGSFDEAFDLYSSVVERGHVFPARWAARLLELGAALSERADIREKMAAVRAGLDRQEARSAALARIFDQLSETEMALAQALIAETATIGQGLELYASMTARGIGFPLEWEEKQLRACLKAEPERIDLNSRYRTVLVTLGMRVPPEIEQAVAEAAKREEYDVDHQLAAKNYHLKTGLDDVEAAFRVMVEEIRPFTMTSMERLYALYKAVHYVVAAQVPGAFVECGVWRGGSMMLIARVLASLNRMDRDLFLFDTFEGLPRPDSEMDVDIWGNRAIDGWLPKQVSETSSHWAEAGLDEVRANIASTGYPADRVHFVKGMVEATIPDAAPREIALLRLDTDWYASTKHEMVHLYPRLSRSGC